MSDLRAGSVLLPQQLAALERVRQAQQRARQTVERTNAQFEAPVSPPAAPVLEPLPEPPPGPRRPTPSGGPPPGMSGNAGPFNAAPSGNAPGRPGGASSILSQLFGGGMGQQGRPASNAANAPANGQPPPRGGLFDLLKGKGLGDSVGSVGETLRSTVSSVSEPLSRLLDAFDIDGEKLIILLVMWVIFNERGDKTLLLALGYLLI